MQMRKRVILMVILGLILSVLPLMAYGSDPNVYGQGNCGDNVSWVLCDDPDDTSVKILTISGTGGITSHLWSALSVKADQAIIVEGVTSIVDLIFLGETFTTVKLPASMETIGEGAFYDCKKLKGITVPEGITTGVWHQARFREGRSCRKEGEDRGLREALL